MTFAPDMAPPGGAAGAASPGRLTDLFQLGLDAPICLTWELTYACNLSCVHCLSSSGRRDPRELSTGECKAVIDTLERMQVFYVNIGGGEPTVRPDFWELVDYATAHHVGVKFSTNGVRLDAAAAARLTASDYVDVQISLDGATREVNDAVRGPGSFDTAMRAMGNLRDAGFRGFKLSVVMTRQNIPQIDSFKAIADSYGAQLRLTRLRPSGRGADVWDELHPLPAQQKELYDWLVAHGEQVLTGDSFFHLSAFGGALPGLNLCGAGRVVCLIDPVGDVYACPFAIHENFLAGNVRSPGGFESVWRSSSLFADLRKPDTGGACRSCGFYDSCRGGCMAAKFFTGLPLDGPDPECVQGHGETALASAAASPGLPVPRPSADHSHRTAPRAGGLGGGPVPVTIAVRRPPSHDCDESPLAGFDARPDGGAASRPGVRLRGSVISHDGRRLSPERSGGAWRAA
jgi:[mycofactocin precursor peptide]-tyrosine decarboxylase / 3-amino-5-[(4-hydroxyphenyl)methyl]-4,4-dimethylpyrrolidin-2-one synthase